MTDDLLLAELGSDERGTEEDTQALSRRDFLTGSLAGGAAGLAVAAGTGVVVWNVADAQAQASLQAAETELARMQGLVDLYENLEKVGLDAILQTGMKAVALPLEGVVAGANALKGGLEIVEAALLTLEEKLPTAQESVQWLEEQVTAVADGIEKLEQALGKALDTVTDNPVAQAISDFAGMVLDNLPFGIGERIRDVLDGLVELVTSVDDLVRGINTGLLEPMREAVSTDGEGGGLAAAVVDPVVEHVLDPLEDHLEGLASLADSVQAELMEPTETALAEREEVRKEIARYKTKHGFS